MHAHVIGSLAWKMDFANAGVENPRHSPPAPTASAATSKASRSASSLDTRPANGGGRKPPARLTLPAGSGPAPLVKGVTANSRRPDVAFTPTAGSGRDSVERSRREPR